LEHAGRLKGALDGIKAFSRTDVEDLMKIDFPTLIAHRDDRQIVPTGASPRCRRSSWRTPR
jgi:non-heme chloroperoxidase